MPKLKQHHSGFTFIEMIVGLAIAAILIAVGVPSFSTFMENAKISTTTNDYMFSLHKARSEAVKRVSGTGMCPSKTSMDADASCSNGASYGDGWIVYADENKNRTMDVDEEILHRMEAKTSGFKFTPDDVFKDQIYFNDSGNIINPIDIPLSGVVKINGRVTVEEL